jgi:hypothetical protein
MNTTENRLLNVPLGNEAHNFAKQNVAEVISLIPINQKKEIGKQIYLNSLAIYTVNSYLQWLGYDSNFNGDFANPLLRSRLNLADLIITGIGNLECRYLWDNETTLIIPNEVTENRIGYILVQFSETLNQGKLLGFTADLNPNQTISINDLKSLDDLIDYLDRLEIANKFLTENDEVAIKVREKLQETSLIDIIVKLERIYRLENKDDQPYLIKDMLTNTNLMTAKERETSIDEDDFEILELAEELLDKLKEMWGNNQ